MMVEEELAKNLEAELAKDFPNTAKALKVDPPFKPIPPVVRQALSDGYKSTFVVPDNSLTDELDQAEKNRREIHNKIKKKDLDLIAENEIEYARIRSSYAAKIQDAVTKLEAERDAVLSQLVGKYHDQRRELDRLLARLGND